LEAELCRGGNSDFAGFLAAKVILRRSSANAAEGRGFRGWDLMGAITERGAPQVTGPM
jgi:hypothetical protein